MTKIKWAVTLFSVFCALGFVQKGFAQSGEYALNEIIHQAQTKAEKVRELIQEEENEPGPSAEDEWQYLEVAALKWPGCRVSDCDFSGCDFSDRSAADEGQVDEVVTNLDQEVESLLNDSTQSLDIAQSRSTPSVAKMAAFRMLSETETAKAALKSKHAVVSVYDFTKGKADIKKAACRAKKLLECCSNLDHHRGRVAYLNRIVDELDVDGQDADGFPTYGSLEILASDATNIAFKSYEVAKRRKNIIKEKLDTILNISKSGNAGAISEFTPEGLSRSADEADLHSVVAGMNASLASLYTSRAKVIDNVRKYTIQAIKAREDSPKLPEALGEPGPGSVTSPGSNVAKITKAERESPIVIEADANLFRAKYLASLPFWENNAANARRNINIITELTEGGRDLNEEDRSIVSGFQWNGVSMSLRDASQRMQEMEEKANEIQAASDALDQRVRREPSPIKPGWPIEAAAAPTAPTTTRVPTTRARTTAPPTTRAITAAPAPAPAPPVAPPPVQPPPAASPPNP